jgi:hypothetical protein
MDEKNMMKLKSRIVSLFCLVVAVLICTMQFAATGFAQGIDGGTSCIGRIYNESLNGLPISSQELKICADELGIDIESLKELLTNATTLRR